MSEEEQAPPPKSKVMTKGGLIALLLPIPLLLLLLLIYNVVAAPRPMTTEELTASNARDAWWECRMAVAARMKNPSSAEFSSMEDANMSTYGPLSFYFRSVVYGTNSFGGVVPQAFVCRVQGTVDDDWEVLVELPD